MWGVRKPHPPRERHRAGTQTSLRPHPQRDSCSEHRRYHCDKCRLDSRSLFPTAFSIPNSPSPPISCLASSPAHTGTCQKEIRQRTLETEETMASETHGELRLTSSPTLTRPELCWATGRLSSCRISYLFPGRALMALTEGRWLQVSTGRHIPSQPCCSYSGRTPINPGVLNVLASQIPCKRKTQT